MQYTFFPIGDSALTIDFGSQFDEHLFQQITNFTKILQQNFIEGIIEIVPAYTTLSIIYNPIAVKKTENTVFETVIKWADECINNAKTTENEEVTKNLVQIPVVYKGEDLAEVAAYNSLTISEVIEIHTQPIYRVYMIGFLPGFAYMGGMDEKIATPRKATPRMSVAAGSVGIAGKQTGIYPLESPGGWQIIGHTPLELFTPHAPQPTLLKAGDFVQFYAI